MSENNFLTKALDETVLTRRSFLKWSAALGGAVALSGDFTPGLKKAEAAATAATESKWVPAACWHNCGGRCLIKAQVVDGTVTRVKTDDTHPDSPDFPQQRGCARGRSQRTQALGADRLKYPMKRVGWAPGGGKKELRGKDQWVRISWDEALNIVASEFKRVKETYGNKAILSKNNNAFLAAYGGNMSIWGTTSSGAWPQPSKTMQATSGSWGESGNDRLDYRNAKLIVLWGSNPIWSSGGSPTYNYLQAKKAGAKFIFVDPFYNDSAMVLGDQWIPVRPSTDTALLMGIAYYMITNKLQDQAFLDKYTSGFDAEHMPKGADPKENFKDYVLGTYDGTPKTPEWASQICGTPPELIRSLAQEIATTKPMTILSTSSPARTYLGEQFAQAFLTVGWMTGNVGLPGAMVSDNQHSRGSYGGPALVRSGGTGVAAVPNPLFNQPTYFGPDPANKEWYGMVWDEVWDAVMTGKYTASVRGKLDCDIKLISHLGLGAALNQSTNLLRGIEAHRKVEFVVTSSSFFTTNAKYSDVVLPVTTMWEREGGTTSGNPEMLIWYSKVVEPLFEAKDDQWIETEIGKRLGLDMQKIYPISDKQMVFNQISGATVMKADASGYEPLVTITEADSKELGVTGKPQMGRIGIKEYKEKGVYQVARTPGDKFGFIAKAAFRADPEKNPLKTASGKLEIYCPALSKVIESYGWNKLSATPKYTPPVEGVEATFSDFKNKVKGDYPLQLYTIHYARRSHSTLDNIPWLREAFPQEFMINSMDASARGIKHGDIVKVTSMHGSVIRPAFVTDRIIPGVTALGEGAWADLDELAGVDKAGATNTLNGGNPTGQGTQPYNSCVVQVEKYDKPLLPDYKWPQRIMLGKEA
ncbi:MAG: molybdopterin-dependent oxidoreductase [Chloroflexi bacterium]|nr:molybdopterin-dependent oxidoreductase [Chloroflexota bacterium]